MTARHLVRILAFAGAAAAVAYLGSSLLFSTACAALGHDVMEAIYASWSTAIFTIACGLGGAFFATCEQA